MPKIVYLIASHTNPEQVVRLARLLSMKSSEAAVVIHHDYSKSYLDPAAFGQMPNVHIMEEVIPVKWGKFSLVEMTLHVIEWIATRIEFDWIAFISGQDYPIQPLHRIEQFLASTEYDGFVSGVALREAMPCGPTECSIADAPGTICTACWRHYYYQFYEISHIPFLSTFIRDNKKLWKRFGRKVNNLQSFFYINDPIGICSLSTPFNENLECYKGSQWFTVNDKCVRYILDFIPKNPHFTTYYKRTLLADESFFQTILFNAIELNILNDNKRYIKWEDSHVRSPSILRKKNFEHIISSNKHFARKFDINVDSDILDLLDTIQ